MPMKPRPFATDVDHSIVPSPALNYLPNCYGEMHALPSTFSSVTPVSSDPFPKSQERGDSTPRVFLCHPKCEMWFELMLFCIHVKVFGLLL